MELIDSRLGLLQPPASYCEDTQNYNKETPPQLSDLSSQGSYGYNDEYNNHKTGVDEDDRNDLDKNTSLMAKSFHSGTLCGSSTVHALGFEATRNNNGPEVHSLINFKSNGCDNFMQASGGSLLSFQQSQTDYMTNFQRASSDPSGGVMNNYNYHPRIGSSDHPRILEDIDGYQSKSTYSSMMTHNSVAKHGIYSNGWLYSESTAVADSIQESEAQEAGVCKRSCTGESTQASKKQCTGASKSSSSKSKSASAKDPQSIAAKNRRERISERLKILQDLVPNGHKVDLVTMLEKAIGYVKFLQLQVKVLATDEFWPVQGGKAPDISQVKEAIDAILSTQRDRNSSSK